MALAIVFTLGTATRSWAAFGLGDMKFDGSLEVNGDSANNETDFGNVTGAGNSGGDNDHRGNTATRVRLGVNMGITEGVSGRLELVRTPKVYGVNGLNGTSGATSIAGEENTWLFHNAYAQINNIWGMDARLGRQYVGDAGDLIWNFGPKSDDSLTVTSIDGLALECAKDKEKMGNFLDNLHLRFFTGKENDDDAIANTDSGDTVGDINVNDLDLYINNVLPGGRINLGYLWGAAADTSLTKDDVVLKIYRIGINGGIKENMLTYRAEFLGNTGEAEGQGVSGADLKFKGTAMDFGLGFNPAETGIGGFSIWGNWTMASGDDNNNNNDDKAFHDFSTLGGANTSDRYFGEIFGKSNTMGGGTTPFGQGVDTGIEGQGLDVLNLGLAFKPKMIEKTSFRLDYFMFSRAEDSLSNGTTSTDVGDKFGDEWDLSMNYQHTDNVGVTLGYAMFSPDDAVLVDAPGLAITSSPVPSGTKDEAVTKLFARLNVKWGGEEK